MLKFVSVLSNSVLRFITVFKHDHTHVFVNVPKCDFMCEEFSLELAVKAQSGSRGIARWGWSVNATHWPLYPRERDSVPIL